MAFGAASAIFQQAMLKPIAMTGATTTAPTSMTATGLLGDTVNVALYGNSGTPNKADTLANTLYNAGQWIQANEIATGGGYTQTGIALGSKAYAIDTGSSSVCFTAANPSWAAATLANVYGDLVYDATLTSTWLKQGMCYHSFGGSAQGVTSGTFTIQWATPGGGAVTAVFNISV
jgi:hypothetical protein